jgi:hypothetical protein
MTEFTTAAAIRDAAIVEEPADGGVVEVTNLVDALLAVAAAIDRVADRMPS